jgi:alpha-beta hydrolase superfamily lysophospholipase
LTGVTAAAVSYCFTDRPAHVPEDFLAPADVDLKFLTITTIDGVTNAAALIQPRASAPSDTTLILHVHGSGGSYYGLPHGRQVMPLAQRGYAGLTINTRGHDDAVNTDNFLEVRNDLAAATVVARALGYQRIILHGQSLGTSQVLYYAATDWSLDIKGVILTGPFANLPWKTQVVLIHDEALYKQLHQEAVAEVRAGRPGTVLKTAMPYLQGRITPVTAQHFLSYRWRETAPAVSTEWIKRVIVPILLVRDASDQIILPFEPAELYAAATAAGALAPDVESAVIPDANPANGHGFANTIAELNDATVKWLERHGW